MLASGAASLSITAMADRALTLGWTSPGNGNVTPNARALRQSVQYVSSRDCNTVERRVKVLRISR